MSIALLIGLTLLLLLYLFVNHFFGKYISANARYVAGLILLIAFLFPYQFSLIRIPMPDFMGTDRMPDTTVTVEIDEGTSTAEISETDTSDSRGKKDMKTPSILYIALISIYVLGAVVFLSMTVRRHLALRKTIKRSLVKPTEDLEWQLDMLCGKMKFRKKPKLLVCRSSAAESLGAPFTFGVFRQKVVLPSNVSGEDAEMLLEHELYHCKRYDALFRLALVTVSVLYWFYLPIIPFVRVLFTVCEESCDAQMTEQKSSAERAAYGKLLIRYASQRAALPVSFSSTGKKLKKRIETLFTQKRRQEGYAFICLTAYAVVLMMGTSFYTPSSKITVYRGADCFKQIEACQTDHSMHEMYDEMYHAFSQMGRLPQLSLCRYMVQTGEFEYARADRLCYEDRLITVVIAESRDGAEFSAVSTYCEEGLAENCVGLRLIYKGERRDDGAMTYAYIAILSDWEMLDYYVWLLLPEDERGATLDDLPTYYKEDGWKERILKLAEEKDPDMVPFYRVLIERTGS